MPAVFVHGVPDTAIVWRPLLECLNRRDVICLSLPGFGNVRASGFQPDKDSYASWLIDELRSIGGERDPYAAARFGERLAVSSRGRFVEIAGAGHWYQVEQPKRVAHELKSFWGGLV